MQLCIIAERQRFFNLKGDILWLQECRNGYWTRMREQEMCNGCLFSCLRSKKGFFKGAAEWQDRAEIHDFAVERNYKNIGIIRTNKKK